MTVGGDVAMWIQHMSMAYFSARFMKRGVKHVQSLPK